MPGYQWLLDIIFIFLYSAACAIYLPLPSEAPMFLFPHLSRITVLLFCALGKGSGAYLVFVTGNRFRQTQFFNRVVELLRIKSFWERLSVWMENFMKAYGFPGFLTLMSVPGMPMRSAIYSISFLKISSLKFASSVAVGTVVRNSLVYWGYQGMKSLFNMIL